MSRDPETKVIRLPRTTYAPSVNDLRYIVQKTRESQGGSVESSWIPPDSRQLYQLRVSLVVGSTMPHWRLSEVVGGIARELWSAELSELTEVASQMASLSGAVQGAKTEPPSPEWVAEIIAASQKASEECAEIDESRSQSYGSGDLDFLGSAADGLEMLERQLRDPVSGLYSHSVLLRMLQYECGRFQTFAVPMSLIVFSIKTPDGQPLSSESATTAGIRLNLIKNPLDVAGVFQEHDLALLLPNTTAAAASFVAHKALDILTASPLSAGLSKSTLEISYSVAGLPDDGDDLSGLLTSIGRSGTQARSGI